ncbi:glycosyltransferase family 9 protein [bacterium]|nr:glycosyltransferase family 9 protein [bacterium]
MKKKVLLIRLSSLGDCIFNIPLANTLKRNGYEVTWLVSEKGYGVIKDNPCVDDVILAPFVMWKKRGFSIESFKEYIQIMKTIRSKKFDLTIDTQMLIKSLYFNLFSGAKRKIIANNARELSFIGCNEFIDATNNAVKSSAIRNYLRFAEHLGLDTSKIEVTLPDSPTDVKEKIQNLLKNIDKTKPVVVIAPATTWVPKHWNRENWKELIEKIEDKFNLIFTGTENDSDLISYIGGDRHINLAGKTNLKDLIELFRNSDLVISLDSGSTHLAWATQVPKIITIFCCTPTYLYAPQGPSDKYIALTGDLSCQPCHKRKCPLEKNKNQCTLLPSVPDVLSAIRKLMNIDL